MVRASFRYAVLLAIVVAVGLIVFVALTYPRFQADVQPGEFPPETVWKIETVPILESHEWADRD